MIDHHKKAKEHLKAVDKAHKEMVKHHDKYCTAMDKAESASEKKKHEGKGFREYADKHHEHRDSDRSAAQRRTLKGDSAKKRREVRGGEKANIKLRRERRHNPY